MIKCENMNGNLSFNKKRPVVIYKNLMKNHDLMRTRFMKNEFRTQNKLNFDLEGFLDFIHFSTSQEKKSGLHSFKNFLYWCVERRLL